MLFVLRQRNFTLLWLGQMISGLGDWGLIIALPFYIYNQTGSALATGAMFVLETLPRVLLGSLAGVFVDRWDRRCILIAADLSRGVMLLFLLAARSPDRIWLVYPVAFLESAITQIFAPAKNALLPCLVGEEHLVEANGLTSLGDDLTMLIGPALGGLLLGWLGMDGVVLVDAASFLTSGGLIGLIDMPPTSASAPVSTGWTTVCQSWLEGLRLVRSDSKIAALFMVSGTAMLGQGILSVLWVVYVREILKGSSVEYGVVQVAVAAGGILGALILGRWGKKLLSDRLIAWGGMAIGLLLSLTFHLPSLPVILVLQFLTGITAVGFFVPLRTFLQSSVHERYLGRIFGLYGMVVALAMLAGQGAAGLLGDRLGIVPALDGSALLYFLGGLLALRIAFDKPPEVYYGG